ncbi:VOC family protein [Alkalihalobacterium alkalinitrilicum]|uniref:VOC family protein n=1 Tax=Alkalihalobacterium alkalinitrilicum TaxID=427920 RepID=UPI003083F500
MSAILNKIGTVFIPVRDIEESKNWYCEILGLNAEVEILYEHLFIYQQRMELELS